MPARVHVRVQAHGLQQVHQQGQGDGPGDPRGLVPDRHSSHDLEAELRQGLVHVRPHAQDLRQQLPRDRVPRANQVADPVRVQALDGGYIPGGVRRAVHDPRLLPIDSNTSLGNADVVSIPSSGRTGARGQIAYTIQGSNIGLVAREHEWSQEELQKIADQCSYKVGTRPLNETRKSVPDKEHKYVTIGEKGTIIAKPSTWLPRIAADQYVLELGKPKADTKTGKPKLYSDIVMLGKDPYFLLNQWTIEGVILEGVDRKVLDAPPRMNNGRPERRIGYDFARIGMPKLATGALLNTMIDSMPRVLGSVAEVMGLHWANASWGVTNVSGNFVYKAANGTKQATQRLQEAMNFLNGRSAYGVATIAISVAVEGKIVNGSVVRPHRGLPQPPAVVLDRHGARRRHVRDNRVAGDARRRGPVVEHDLERLRARQPQPVRESRSARAQRHDGHPVRQLAAVVVRLHAHHEHHHVSDLQHELAHGPEGEVDPEAGQSHDGHLEVPHDHRDDKDQDAGRDHGLAQGSVPNLGHGHVLEHGQVLPRGCELGPGQMRMRRYQPSRERDSPGGRERAGLLARGVHRNHHVDSGLIPGHVHAHGENEEQQRVSQPDRDQGRVHQQVRVHAQDLVRVFGDRHAVRQRLARDHALDLEGVQEHVPVLGVAGKAAHNPQRVFAQSNLYRILNPRD
ncbi:hypothetical protein SCAR479_13555 [Seiridium cardinale]|uniref:Uncharacterized protein n=1 Tax=Seiridium cardinale TaxID=138064 RepID=A0ABR2X7N3_9PEZI